MRNHTTTAAIFAAAIVVGASWQGANGEDNPTVQRLLATASGVRYPRTRA